MTKKQADKAVREVAVYLAKKAKTGKVNDDYTGETEAAGLARGFAYKLLSAAKCDGLGGCRLCQG
jgi:hypothetical protein